MWKFPIDWTKPGIKWHYLGTTGLYGTAYAASLGSEKYSSDFGWSAAPSYSSKKYESWESNHHKYTRYDMYYISD